MSLVHVTDLTPPFKLLAPVTSSPRPHTVYDCELSARELDDLVRKLKRSDYVALDIETTGLNPYTDNIVGIGLSGSRHTFYIDTSSQDPELLTKFYQDISSLPLVAHNLMFDGYWMLVKTGLTFNWQFDTYGLFKHLASEGFPGQSWALKDAQLSLLGWDAKGDVELDEWLCANGYIKGNQKDKADKSQMWRAPSDILGKYCAMDADSTYQLLIKVFAPVLKKYPGYHRYHLEEFITLIDLLNEQRKRGMLVDKDYTELQQTKLDGQIEAAKQAFLAHPLIREHLVHFKSEAMKKAYKGKAAPARYKKNGEVSKNWIKYCDRVCEAYRTTELNLNSPIQLQELFYGKLYPPTRHTDRRGRVSYTVNNVTLDATQSGQPPTDAAALRWLGAPGKLLANYKDVIKLKTFIDKYLELMDGAHILRPGWRTPGTLTGRLSGSEPNFQQVPKNAQVLDCFPCRPGYKLVGADFASLENVVLAELSRDTNLLKLYGPTARPNCGYLFFGSQLPVIGPIIRAAGYDPDNPTAETVAAAKKKAKAQRSIAKVLVLSDQYGAGAEKKFKTLRAQGVAVTATDVKRMHDEQQRLLAGLSKYRRTLELQWERNGGYIINGFGRPLAVADNLTKDLVNRDGQSTGHDCTMRWIYHIDQLRGDLDAHPYIVDFHDESIWEVREDQVEQFIEVMQQANNALNSELKAAGWICQLKIDAVTADTLTGVKMD